MKKFTKFALGCAITCAAVGLGLSVAGLAMGAVSSGKDVLADVLDNTLNSENMRWSVSVLRDDEDWDDMDEEWNHSASSRVENGFSIFEFDNFKNMDIELSADELYLRKYDGNGIRIETEENDDKVRVREDEDTLKIKSLTKMNGTKITVYYPTSLDFNEVDIDVDAGSIYLEDDISMNELDIHVGAGKMHSNGTITVNEIMIDVGTGNVEMKELDARILEAECGVGALNIGLVGTEADYSYKVECGLGRVHVGDETYSGISETAKVNNENANRRMELECGLGDITVGWRE